MKLYIANGTNQIQSVWYRLPGNDRTGANRWDKPVELVIPQGMQVKVPEDLLPEEVDCIISQHARYGLIKADEVDRTKPYVGLCYSIDKPVPSQKIEKLFNHNKGVLEKRVDESLMTTALANNKLLEDRVVETAHEARHALPKMGDHEISITEIPRHGSPQKTDFFRSGKEAAGVIRMGRA